MAGETSQKNGKKGGRPKGSKAAHTLEAQEQRKLIVKFLGENLEPILKGLLKRAIKGDSYAARELFDRAYGRPHQSSDVAVREMKPFDDLPPSHYKKLARTVTSYSKDAGTLGI